MGPEDFLYENSVIKLNIKFPPNYPFQKPHFKFKTRIYQPNVGYFGGICIDVLYCEWIPQSAIIQVFIKFRTAKELSFSK